MRAYETHESMLTDARMYLNMLRRAFLVGAVIQIFFLGYYFYHYSEYVGNIYTIDKQKVPTVVVLKYFTGLSMTERIKVDTVLVPYAKGWPDLPLSYYRAVADYATNDAFFRLKQAAEQRLYQSIFCYIFSVFYVVIFWYIAKTKKEEQFLRGAQTTSLRDLNRRLARAAGKSGGVKIGETVLPRVLEPKHILILGASGSGKGVLLNQMLGQIINRRQDRVVIYDPKGEFVEKLYRPGDLIFNCFDQRSVGWNIFNEISSQPDYDIIARSLFAPPDSKDTYWYTCAADVFRTGLVYLRINQKTKNSEMWEFFSQPLQAIQSAFRTLPVAEQGAIKHIDKADSQASASIISILQERLQAFRYIREIEGDFSFSRYIREESQGNIFLLGNEKTRTLMKPLLSLAVDIMCRETLSLPDNLNRRIFFAIDELGTLNKMDSILTLETVGRSKGACLICANQDLGRIEEVYGRAALKTFFNNFNTNFMFRIREPETAEFISRAIGEQQLLKTTQSRQMSPNDVGDRKSMSDHEKMERLFLPTELQQLPDLHAILSVAGFGVSEIAIPALFFKSRNEPFIERVFADFSRESPAASAAPIADQLRI
ncbi:type IV secretion system DNA-binding domain-containing protein [Sporomusa sphaeroides]|uniref:type IV secretion system DNA-binding domain-containing protein n=1 Tax=Sporomusa sphaeroides TaxID=47679 RepID=UPI0031588E48